MAAKKMIKVKILKCFNDKYTKERREVNDVCDYSEDRAKYLEKNGYAEIIKEEKKGE